MATHDVLTDRPEFMQILGLLPPYTVADVENAYLERVRELESDSGAGKEMTSVLRVAYECGLDFARFRESRRLWMPDHIEHYTSRQATIDRIDALGGKYVQQDATRFLWSYGEDFAEIMRQLVQVDLTGPRITDSALDCLSDENLASEIMVLVLRDSTITDAGLSRIGHLRALRCLDLRNTSVSKKSFETLCSFPKLEWIQLSGTSIGAWTRRRLSRRQPRLEIAVDELATAPPVYEASYEHGGLMKRLLALPANEQ